MLKVQNLCFGYYKKPLCLKDVNLEIKSGSKNLIIASEDMGKTTSLKVFSSFETGYFGKILLNNKDIKTISDKDKNFSLVLEKPVFFENKTIKQNFDYFCEINNFNAFNESEIEQFLSEFRIDAKFSDKVKKLSEFDKKKLAIKRALLKKSTILFLDDQFENLTEQEAAEMFDIYSKILKDKNQTVIFTIGEIGFKYFRYNNCINLDNVYYLCDAVLRSYKNIKDFLDEKDNFNTFKFLDGYESVLVNLLIDKDRVMIKFDQNLFEIDQKLLKQPLEIDEYECLLLIKQCDSESLNAEIIAKLLSEKSANLYLILTGEKLI